MPTPTSETPTSEMPTSEVPMTEVTMQAIVQDRFGADAEHVLRLGEVARPTPGDGEVLVRVAAAGVDRGTWHLVAGLPYAVRLAGFGVRRPKQPVSGLDLAGTVEQVGPGVEGFALGDEVFGIGSGSFAELAVARADKLAHKPASLSSVEAAALPVSGLTALQAVRDQVQLEAGESVLVLGASGGVGSYVVQIAAALGAEVTGVCRTSKVYLVRSLCEDHVVDRTVEDAVDGSRRYDAIIDLGGNRRLRDLRRALTPSGRLVIAGGEEGGRLIGGVDRQARAMLWSPFVSQTLGAFISSENAADLRALAELVEAGSVTPSVERTYPLADAPAAVRHVGDGKARGKVVIEL